MTAEQIKSYVGNKVLTRRTELSLTQQDVAEYINKSRVYLCGRINR